MLPPLCIRHDADGRDRVTEEIRIRGADGSLRRGKLGVVLLQAQEECLHFRDVTGGIGVEDDDVVEVGSDAVEALDDLVGPCPLLPDEKKRRGRRMRIFV